MTVRDDIGLASTPQRANQWLSDRLTALGVTSRFARDAVLAAVATVATFALFGAVGWFAPDELDLTTPQARWILAAACVQALGLCLRRVQPWLCLAVMVGCQVVIIATAPDITARGFAPLIAAYTIGTLVTVRTAFAAAAVAALAEGGAGMALAAAHPTGTVVAGMNHLGSAAGAYLVAAFVGSYVATRRRYLRMVREQAAAAIRTQQARTRAAIAAERSQLARELHDVAAHHLSSMVIQAAAVDRLIERDPAAARAGAAWIRAQGKETLDNLRQVVGLLRHQDDPAADGTAPVPGVGALEELVRTARDLGTDVQVVREGAAVGLPPIADISFYRVAQQALTNARQHAPGAPVRIHLQRSDREIALDIVNGPPPHGTSPSSDSRDRGTGLVGMRERAALVGAELIAGPTPDAGWRVRLRLPVRPVQDRAGKDPIGGIPA